LIVGDAAGVDQALQGIGGFAAIEHAQQLPLSTSTLSVT
jgi:hypothetical protein